MLNLTCSIGIFSTQSTILWSITLCLYIKKNLHSAMKLTNLWNWSLQPFRKNCQVASHTICVVYVNFIHVWWDLQFKVDSEWQILGSFLTTILFTLRVFPRNLLKGSRRRNIFIFLFWCQTWGLNSGSMSNKPTHYQSRIYIKNLFHNFALMSGLGFEPRP